MVRGNIDLVPFCVLQDQVLLLLVVRGHVSGAGETGHAVVNVHHVFTGYQLRQEGLPFHGTPGPPASLFHGTEDVSVSQEGDPTCLQGQVPAFPQVPGH